MVTTSVARDTPHGVEFGIETVTTVFWAFGGQPSGVTAVRAAIAAWDTLSSPESQEVAA
nr:hypothetical protein GCM10017611_13970 [Rhodococcus wratislaviensis]